jgi:predicted phosphohydrolase
MDKYGGAWVNHVSKIKNNWLDIIKPDDTVLICGDISWAMRIDEALLDLGFVDNLPGHKIIISGNHDYYFGQLNKLKGRLASIDILKNNYYIAEGIGICGTRGWVCPNAIEFSDNDEKIYKRELKRLRLSLDSCIKSGVEEIYIMMHFPPTNEQKEVSGFIEIAGGYPVKKFIYGHLHGEGSFYSSLMGSHYGIEFILTSGDYLGFKPVLI